MVVGNVTTFQQTDLPVRWMYCIRSHGCKETVGWEETVTSGRETQDLLDCCHRHISWMIKNEGEDSAVDRMEPPVSQPEDGFLPDPS